MITMPMAGCLGGDDSSDAPDEELADWSVHFAATAEDLPTCDEDTNGRLYYVEADNQFQVCKTSGWTVIDIQGADGSDGMNGADGADGVDGADGAAGADGQDGSDGTSVLITTSSSTSCANGGNTFNIGPDSNSNGFLEASEVVMNVDVCNGAQGPQGPQGPAGNDGVDGNDGAPGADGNDGQDGQDGVDGSTPVVTPLAPGDQRCPQGGVEIDVNGNVDVVCDGIDGADGDTTLAVATTLSGGSSNCWGDGGVQIDVGVDDNNNGVLDSSEIDDTTYICNGGDGADGDSAYQIWLNNGNTGSEQDYLDSLEANATYLINIQSVLDNVTTCVIGAYANCSGASFLNLDLSNLDLTGIDFSYATLNNVDFSNSTLEFADFTGANIDDVDFTNAEMAYAILVGADIYNPDFENADLTGVDFSSIHEMTGLFYSYRYTVSSYISSYTGCGGGIYSGYITGYVNNFRSVPISFENATLNGANFGQSLLFTSDFTNASANHANFDDTMKYENDYTTSYVSMSSYLSKTGGDDAAPASCYYARMEARSSQTYYLISTFTNFDASYSSFERSNVITAADLDYANLMHSNLMYVYIGSADLTGADLGDSWLHFTSFNAATVNGASFSGSNWYQTIWTDGLAYNSNQA